MARGLKRRFPARILGGTWKASSQKKTQPWLGMFSTPKPSLLKQNVDLGVSREWTSNDFLMKIRLTKQPYNSWWLLIGSFSHYLQGLIHPRWLFGISSINSSELQRVSWRITGFLIKIPFYKYPLSLPSFFSTKKDHMLLGAGSFATHPLKLTDIAA